MTRSFRNRATQWVPIGTFALFFLACALCGGSSRSDAPALLVLRVVTVACLFVFLLATRPADWRVVRAPLLLLAALALVVAIQLVPLPPALWQALPGRGRFAPGLALAGAQREWHPLSIAPDRTWDSLVGLLVPLTVLVGYAALDARARRWTVGGLLLLGGASATLGVAQLASGSAATLLYARSDISFAVGLFANKNHEGVLLVCLLPVLRAWRLADPHALWRGVVAGVAGLALVPAILVTGSRAGLLLLPVGVAAAWLVRPAVPRSGVTARRAGIGAAAAVLVVAGIAGVFVATGRAFAIDRLLGGGSMLADQRYQNAGTVLHVARAALPLGWGFGTFDPVFRMFEPDALLRQVYFNNAHDDFLELLVTGGLPGIAVLAAFLWWAARRAGAAARRPADAARAVAGQVERAAAAAIGIVLLASLVDYPLRTPLFGAVFALWCAWLTTPPAAANRLARPGGVR